jgi:hypothetical protein
MKINVVTRISQDVEVEVSINEVIETINQLDIAPRFNYIAKILNEVSSGDLNDLNMDQIELIQGFLNNQLSRIDDSFNC